MCVCVCFSVFLMYANNCILLSRKDNLYYVGNSLGFGVTKSTFDQMVNLYGASRDHNTPVIVLHCSQQPDGVSCGLYALAYATLFAHNIDVHHINKVAFNCSQLWKWYRTQFDPIYLQFPALPPYTLDAHREDPEVFGSFNDAIQRFRSTTTEKNMKLFSV